MKSRLGPVKERNSKVVKVDWRFSTADARIKLKRLYPKIHMSNQSRNIPFSAKYRCPIFEERLVAFVVPVGKWSVILLSTFPQAILFDINRMMYGRFILSNLRAGFTTYPVSIFTPRVVFSRLVGFLEFVID